MEGRMYGYIRVSSMDQNEDRQLMAMKKVNFPEKQIFMDKIKHREEKYGPDRTTILTLSLEKKTVTQGVTDRVTDKVTDGEKAVLNLIAENSQMSYAEMAEALGKNTLAELSVDHAGFRPYCQ